MEKNIYIMVFQGFLFLIYGLMKILKNTLINRRTFFGYYVDEYLAKEEKDKYKKDYLREAGIVGGVAILILTLVPFFLENRAMFIISNLIYILVFEILDIRWSKIIRQDGKLKTRKNIYLKNATIEETIPFSYFIMPVGIILFNTIFGMVLYNKIPDKLPTNWDLSGNISGQMIKSLKNIFLMPMFQIFLTFIILAIFIYLRKSKKLLNPMEEAKSTEREIIYRRVWSFYLLLALNLTLVLLTILNMMTLRLFDDIILFNTINAITIWFILGGGILLILLLGGGGDNLIIDRENKDLKSEEYKFWKFENKIYINGRNKNLFVENRNGIGLVINLARPMGMIIYAFPLIVIFVSMYINL